MTDSTSGRATAGERRPGKRERLVAAATQLLHQQGDVAELMRLPIEWAERQFRSLGRQDARDLAFDLLAAY